MAQSLVDVRQPLMVPEVPPILVKPCYPACVAYLDEGIILLSGCARLCTGPLLLCHFWHLYYTVKHVGQD